MSVAGGGRTEPSWSRPAPEYRNRSSVDDWTLANMDTMTYYLWLLGQHWYRRARWNLR